MVIAISTIALNANDQCTPIKPPTTPTVTPLKALNPMLVIENKTDHAAAQLRRRAQLHNGLGHRREGQIQHPGDKQQRQR